MVFRVGLFSRRSSASPGASFVSVCGPAESTAYQR